MLVESIKHREITKGIGFIGWCIGGTSKRNKIKYGEWLADASSEESTVAL
jgi:hypothetical protein